MKSQLEYLKEDLVREEAQYGPQDKSVLDLKRQIASHEHQLRRKALGQQDPTSWFSATMPGRDGMDRKPDADPMAPAVDQIEKALEEAMARKR